MSKQGWNYALRTLGIAALAVSISGCQTVRPGAAHPFYTLFSHTPLSDVRSAPPADVVFPVSPDEPVTYRQFSTQMPPWFQLPDTPAVQSAHAETEPTTQL